MLSFLPSLQPQVALNVAPLISQMTAMRTVLQTPLQSAVRAHLQANSAFVALRRSSFLQQQLLAGPLGQMIEVLQRLEPGIVENATQNILEEPQLRAQVEQIANDLPEAPAEQDGGKVALAAWIAVVTLGMACCARCCDHHRDSPEDRGAD